jgi:hypothetical protein
MNQLKLPSFHYRQAYETKINSIRDIRKLFFDDPVTDLYYRGMSKYEYICVSSFYRYYLSKYSNIKWEEATIAYGKSLKLPVIDSEDYIKLSFEIIDDFKENLAQNGLYGIGF